MLALVIERDPLKLEQLPAAMQSWIAASGSFAAVAIVIGLAFYAARGVSRSPSQRRFTPAGFAVAVLFGGAFFLLLPVGMRILWNRLGWVEPAAAAAVSKLPWYQPFIEHFRIPPTEVGAFMVGRALRFAVCC